MPLLRRECRQIEVFGAARAQYECSGRSSLRLMASSTIGFTGANPCCREQHGGYPTLRAV